MRFAQSGYYIEKYIKCETCGVLVYDEGLRRDASDSDAVFCSEWCVAWYTAKESGEESPRVDLPFHR
jgi:5-oxoprolinase (ATP-hydrolysing)/N-methylhydantoinase B